MSRTKQNILLIVMAAWPILMIGCSENERVAQLATQAADRQAQQNHEMARVTREVAEGAKYLVEADAVARREQLAMQHELQSEQVRIGGLHDQLEIERREIARQRRVDSMLGPVIQGCGTLLVAALAIGFGVLLLNGLRKTDDSGEVLGNLILQDLVADQPALLPFNDAPRAIEQEPDSD